jgi:hypothetical protein
MSPFSIAPLAGARFPFPFPFPFPVVLSSLVLLASCGGGASPPGEPVSDKQQALASANWTTVAREGQPFNVAGTGTIRYGAGTRWVSKTVSGAAACTNEFFGTDPAPTVGKTCESMGSGSQTPPAGTGSATLSWAAPQTNADGSALTDLAGFRIYYGSASGSYSKSITISSPTTLRYTIDNLPSGTHYFVVKAFDAARNESAPSPEVSKTIR